jgi:hypothetical protein
MNNGIERYQTKLEYDEFLKKEDDNLRMKFIA